MRSAGRRSAALWTGENEPTYTCHLKYLRQIKGSELFGLLSFSSSVEVTKPDLCVLQRPVQVQWCVVSIGWR